MNDLGAEMVIDGGGGKGIKDKTEAEFRRGWRAEACRGTP